MCVCVIWFGLAWFSTCAHCTVTHFISTLVWRCVALNSLCDRVRVSFMLITRIINDTRFVVIYRYFLDVDQWRRYYQAICIYVILRSNLHLYNLQCMLRQQSAIIFYAIGLIRMLNFSAYRFFSCESSPGNWFIL